MRNARPVTSNAVERGGVWLLSGSLSFGIRAGWIQEGLVLLWESNCYGSQGNMSSIGTNDIEVEELVREIREQGIVRRFDFYTTRGVVPPRGAVVLRSLGFGRVWVL